MSQYLTSFCERDQRKERKTLNFFSSNVDLCTFAIQKNRCWIMLSQDLYHFLCLEQYHKCFSYSSLFYIIYAYFVFTVCVWLSCKTQLTGRSDKKDVEKVKHFCCILLRGAVCLAAKPWCVYEHSLFFLLPNQKHCRWHQLSG